MSTAGAGTTDPAGTGERRLRILVTASTFPTAPDSGVPRFVFDLADAIGRYAEVFVLAPDGPGASPRERLGRVEVRRFAYFRPRALQRLALGHGMPDNLRRSWLARAQVPWFLVRQTVETRRLVRAERIEVVNAHWLLPQGLTAAWAVGRARSVRLVLHAHGGDAHLLSRIPAGGRLLRFMLDRADALFVAGSTIKTTLDELAGRDSGAILQPMGTHRAPNGEPDERTLREIAPGAPSFPAGFLLFVGRMIELKGVEYLIRSLPALREKHETLGLVLVGDGPRRPAIEEEVSRLGLQGAVCWLGTRPHRDIRRLLRLCRALVVPSIVDGRGRTDGMPTVIVEGMAAGARIVATRVGGIPDVIVHARNGWLCDPRDPAELGRAIESALDDPTAPRVAATAAEHSARYDWDRIARAYVARMSSLIGKDRG